MHDGVAVIRLATGLAPCGTDDCMKASRIREPAASLPITRERASAGLHIGQPSRIPDSLAAPMTAVPASRVLGQTWQGYVQQTVPTEFQIKRDQNPSDTTQRDAEHARHAYPRTRLTPATSAPGLTRLTARPAPTTASARSAWLRRTRHARLPPAVPAVTAGCESRSARCAPALPTALPAAACM